MLIGNGIRLASSNPMRTMGGASAFNIERSNYGRNGAMNNFYAGDATVEAGASIANKSAFPVGYVDPYCWHPAMKSGGMACRVIAGTGEVTSANGANGYNIDADLTGTGDVTEAIGALIVSAVASLTGSGEVTAASMAGIIEAAASLTGSGEVAAAIGAIVEMVAGLTGEGTVSAEATAKGSMASEITVTGDLLSTANVGDAVWSTLLEAGFTASQIVRIVAAATAGASSGGPSSPVFRNLGDTDDMISGTADSNGNRSSITYGE